MNDRRRHSAEKGSHAKSMGTPQPSEPQQNAARLYLVTPPISAASEIEGDLARALNAADIAAVLVRLAPGDGQAQIKRVADLRILIQSNGAALLIDGHPDLVAPTQADGAHLTGTGALIGATPALKPKFIAGCGGLTTRHDAMLAGESGADYVMFGEPDTAGQRPGFEAVHDRVVWWAEIFQIPCVGYAASLDEAEALAQVGADFVALDPKVWREAHGVETAMKRLAMEPAR
jgi:thiamine-phosphate pyrophosphorylase